MYPIIRIRSGIKDFAPEESLAEGVSNGLSLPVYESISPLKSPKGGVIHTLSQERNPQ